VSKKCLKVSVSRRRVLRTCSPGGRRSHRAASHLRFFGRPPANHVVIEFKQDGLLLRDLGSTNGTFVNGEKITAVLMKPGDHLRVADLEATLEPAWETIPTVLTIQANFPIKMTTQRKDG